MVHLTQASRELFRRSPDERFETLEALVAHCRTQRDSSTELWQPPREMQLTGKLAAAATNLVDGEGYTVFALVDALTRLSGRLVNAGDRLAADQQAASLLAVAA